MNKKKHNEAIRLFQSGDTQRALIILKNLLKKNPVNLSLLNDLAIMEVHQKKYQDAINNFNKIILIDKTFYQAYLNRGNCFLELQDYEYAKKDFQFLLSINYKSSTLNSSFANCLFHLDKYNEAITYYKKSLKESPNLINVLYDLAVCYENNNNYTEAIITYKKVLKESPDNLKALLNIANCFKEINNLTEAYKFYSKTIEIDSSFIEGQWNLSLLQLLQGNYNIGWKNYESRKKRKMREKNYPFLGEDIEWFGDKSINGKTIYISKEQGLGDYIQFCRYLPLVKDMGAKIILDTPPVLQTLINSLGIKFDYFDGLEKKQFQYHSSIMSLPLAFKTELNSIPNKTPYLFISNDKKNFWKKKLGKKMAKRVGLAWSGNSKHANNKNRSISLKHLQSLFELQLEFHSLQIEYNNDDKIFMNSINNLKNYENDLKDFSDTAGLIEEMDLIISVDTSVAHLSGALGKPVWILIPFSPDFRWLTKRNDSPWYPSAKLYRQTDIVNWKVILDKLKNDLIKYKW